MRTILMVTASLALAGCASAPRSAPGGQTLTFSGGDQEIAGTLIEARCYFNTGATGGDHELCAFLSAKVDLPLGILTDDGAFVLVTSAPSQLASYVTRRVEVRGTITANRQLVRPEAMRARVDGAWREVAL
jgi:hypothetical protein